MPTRARARFCRYYAFCVGIRARWTCASFIIHVLSVRRHCAVRVAHPVSRRLLPELLLLLLSWAVCVHIYYLYNILYMGMYYTGVGSWTRAEILYYIRWVNGREDEDLSFQIMTLLLILIYIYTIHVCVCMRIILYPFNLFDLCTHVGQ